MARVSSKQIEKMLDMLYSLGFDYTLNRPDRDYRLHIWPRIRVPDLWPREIYFIGTLGQCYEVMKAVVMAVMVDRAMRK